jgi:hypothetical protein
MLDKDQAVCCRSDEGIFSLPPDLAHNWFSSAKMSQRDAGTHYLWDIRQPSVEQSQLISKGIVSSLPVQSGSAACSPRTSPSPPHVSNSHEPLADSHGSQSISYPANHQLQRPGHQICSSFEESLQQNATNTGPAQPRSSDMSIHGGWTSDIPRSPYHNDSDPCNAPHSSQTKYVLTFLKLFTLGLIVSLLWAGYAHAKTLEYCIQLRP